MEILVTGGLGYIGSHTVISLFEAGFNPIIIDNLSNSKIEQITKIEALTGKRFKFYIGDIRDVDLLERVFTENDIDLIMHFAALKSVNESIKDPFLYYDNNVNGTLTLLNAMKQFNIKRFVFSSSAAVYSLEKLPPFIEGDLIDSSVPYAKTKIEVEIILRRIASEDPECHIAILRYFNPIGAHRSGIIGEDPTSTADNIMPKLIDVALGKSEFLYIYGSDYNTHDGTCIRDYIHVMDAAEGHVYAVRYLVENKGLCIFNLGTGVGTSVLELVHAFQRVNDIKIPYVLCDRRKGDVPVSFASVSRAKAILGWSSRLTLDDMVKDAWGYVNRL